MKNVADFLDKHFERQDPPPDTYDVQYWRTDRYPDNTPFLSGENRENLAMSTFQYWAPWGDEDFLLWRGAT